MPTYISFYLKQRKLSHTKVNDFTVPYLKMLYLCGRTDNLCS